MSNIHKHFGWAVLASELSHVFCCVLPTLVTIMGVLSSAGLIAGAPDFIEKIHDTIHHYEVPIIVFSGVMVALGWVFHLSTRTVDCHATGCVHPPCDQKKVTNSKILLVATALFAVNLVIYFGIHQNIFGIEALDVHHDHAH